MIFCIIILTNYVSFIYLYMLLFLKKAFKLSFFILLCCVFLIPSFSYSQSIGALKEERRAIERQQHLQEKLEQQQQKRQKKALDALVSPSKKVDANTALPQQESPCFSIHTIVFSGVDNVEISSRLLRGLNRSLTLRQEVNQKTKIIDSPKNRCLGAQGINILLSRAQNHLISKGYVTTRVLAGEQDLTTGTLVLTVIPGRLANIHGSSKYKKKKTLVHIKTAIPTNTEKILNIRDIEQGLENLKRVPTADANVEIFPTENKNKTALLGYSDLIVQYQQKLPLRLNISLDDSGTDSTGKIQGTATLSVDNPLRLNDLFYVTHSRALGGGNPYTRGSRGTQAYHLHYSIPYGYWLLSLNYNASKYHQTVAGATKKYIYSGNSKNAEITLGRVLHRNAQSKTTLTMKAFGRTSRNYIDDAEVEVQRRRTAGWAAQLNHRRYIGVVTLDLNLGYKRGTGAFNAQRAPEELFNEGTSRFAIVTANATLNLPFQFAQQKMRLNSQLRWQYNKTGLTYQDRFAIGGRYTVRGFDGKNSLIGERGWFIRNDLGIALGNTGQELYFGLDYGQVGGPSSDYLLGKSLSGAIIGLRGSGKKWIKGLHYDVFISKPIYKPSGFRTANATGGFNVSWSF